MRGFRLIPIVLISFFYFQTVNQIRADEDGSSETIGFYTAGCIKNSETLPSDGEGYQVIRLSRDRYYGHPELINFVKSFAKAVSNRYGGRLLIGDLSQKNGGPMPDGHSSHQVGLDADILFWQNPVATIRKLTEVERELIEPLSLLTSDFSRIDPNKWSPIHAKILKLAASYDNVERIFVNPHIKRKLCGMYQGEEWLKKIRPWWGHDGHFHVRLRCPDNNPLCESQEPVTEWEGCGVDLAQWFNGDSLREKAEDPAEPRIIRKLPDECLSIVY